MRALMAGWFSFDGMGATAGDLIARDVVGGWLDRAGVDHDVAVAPPFDGGVDWRSVDPAAYTHVIFVCGPFGNGEPVTTFLKRLEGRAFVGVNLTMLESLDDWDPFDLLLERDSSRQANPDLVFLGPPPTVPVVGLVRIHAQPEYGRRDLHERANDALIRVLSEREAAVVPIDTRLDERNLAGLRTPGEIEALFAKMDVVATTRLHGMVLALKNGVPAVVIDPVAGGAKITRQAAVIGWPTVFSVDDLSDEGLRVAFAHCLTADARSAADRCGRAAREALEAMHDDFAGFFTGAAGSPSRRDDGGRR